MFGCERNCVCVTVKHVYSLSTSKFTSERDYIPPGTKGGEGQYSLAGEGAGEPFRTT
jgi:hypothetical protein